MRAVRCHELTGPSGLRVDEVLPPVPGPNDVLIEVHAAGLNFPDVLMSYGKYQFKADPPFIPGGEAAGVVVAVGTGVTRVAPGDRVVATLMMGAFAEQILAPEATVVKLPDAVSFEVGAATLLTYATTLHALVDRSHLQAGETLLVLGAAGGVGTAAVEIGRMLGARVIAAASTPEKLAYCREHGANEGIDYVREDLKDRMKALTRGTGANVVFDPVGGPYTDAALRSIAWEGRYLVVGFAAGEIPKVPLNLALLKGCQIVGVFWGAFVAREPERNRTNAEAILDHVAAGRLAPHVDTVHSFAEAPDAFARMERREVMGKIVLVPR